MNGRGGKRRFLLALCLTGTLLFTALGIWQMERRSWKLDLIERVNARVAAPPAPLPPRSSWASLRPGDFEYRRARLHGRFLHERETLVDALTALGPGRWVITPLATPQGIVLVNRGFVPPDQRTPQSRARGQVGGVVTVTGLLRRTEPNGRVLRPNRPTENRWFSRDVAAIAASTGLDDAAPFFVDADATPNPGGLPVGGLTVISFRNTHLVYALTWFALAGLSIAGMVLLLRSPRVQS